jgi:hypothetical protein
MSVKPIDKFSLDQDCIEQPQLFQDAADAASVLAEERDIAKMDMDTCYATMDIELRQEATDKGERITDKAVDSLINASDEYIEAKRFFLEKRKDASLADNERTAYEQRKSMLEYLIKLYLSDYYSDVDTVVNKTMDQLSKNIMAGQIKKELYSKKGDK